MERQRSFSPIRPFELIFWAYKLDGFVKSLTRQRRTTSL